MQSKLPVAVIGAGPVGLAAAAHLAARGEAFVVLETGASVGHSMLQWGHVRVFSPWRHNVDRTARRLLEFSGWRHPTADALPTGREIVQVLTEIPAGVESGWHQHPGEEVGYIVAGTVRMEIHEAPTLTLHGAPSSPCSASRASA